MFHHFPKTNKVCILISITKNDGSLSLLVPRYNEAGIIGIVSTFEARVSTSQQISDCLTKEFQINSPNKSMRIEEKLTATLIDSDSQEHSLFLVHLDEEALLTIPAEKFKHLSWPDLLKSLPANKNRISYLKFWQLLAGTHKENLKVLTEKSLN